MSELQKLDAQTSEPEVSQEELSEILLIRREKLESLNAEHRNTFEIMR